MLYCLVFAIGGTLGFLLFAWVRGAPMEPYIAHEHCDERFNRMHKRLSHDIQVREDEIQRLIQGEVAYQLTQVANADTVPMKVLPKGWK